MEKPRDPAFFVAGGTVPTGSRSYVERAADRDLFEALLAGEFCFVLNSRQMGKSSLAVRTIVRLTDAKVRAAFVDLTRLGGATVTAEQWYAGLLVETGRALGLRSEAATHLRGTRELGPAQRFLAFLSEVALNELSDPLVVMIDEIDAVRSLPFPTDELFAGIRQLHNERASEPALCRLTFCLLGAALPNDLIRDPRTTPFNVGRRIELRDFTAEEAKPFAAVVGEATLARVLHWTGGHPFLTQALCAELAKGRALHSEPPPLACERRGFGVDALVRSRYLDARARETDTNLTDVGNRLLGRGDPGVDDPSRADVLALLSKMNRGGIPDDEANPANARLKLSGAARLESGRLRPRNRIYRQAFGEAWIRENTPGAELRRARRAFWKGAARTAAVAGLVVAVVGVLAFHSARLAAENARQRDAARYQAYAASMQTLSIERSLNNLTQIERVLDEQAKSPDRGWEWDFWHRLTHREAWRVGLDFGVDRIVPLSADGSRLAALRRDALLIVDAVTGRTLRTFPPPVPNDLDAFVWWTRDNRRLLVRGASDAFLLFDTETGAIQRLGHCARATVPLSDPLVTTPDDRAFLAYGPGHELYRVDLPSLRMTRLPLPPGIADAWRVRMSRDGSLFASTGVKERGRDLIVVQSAIDGREIRRVALPLGAPRPRQARTLAGGTRLLVASTGELRLLDAASGRTLWALPVESGTELQQVQPFGDERRFVVSGGDGVTRLVEMDDRQGRVVARFPQSYSGYLAGDGAILVTVGDSLRGYRVRDAAEIPERRLPIVRVMGAEFGLKGDLLVGGIPGFSVDATHTGGSARLLEFHDPAYPLHDPTRSLRVGAGAYEIRDLPDGKRRLRIPFDAKADPYGRDSWSGRWFVAATSERALSAYDLQTGSRVARFESPGDTWGLAFSEREDALAGCGHKGEVAVWDVPSWRPRWRVHEPGDGGVLAFSPDGAWLAAMTGLVVKVYDARNGRVRSVLTGCANRIGNVAWSRDGRRIATASGDGTLRIWDPATGHDLGIIAHDAGATIALTFLPDGRTLAGFDEEGRIRWWPADHAVPKAQ